MTWEDDIQAEDELLGMCYFSKRLYTLETCRPAGYGKYGLLLAVYSVTDKDTMALLDTLDLKVDVEMHNDDVYNFQPRVDLQTGKVYIVCGHHGVCVVRYDGSKLVPVTTLRCVGEAVSLAVVSPDTLYVCDRDSKAVCVVDVNQDKVTDRLQERLLLTLSHIAVLGDSVLMAGWDGDMFIYRHGISRHERPTILPVRLDVRALTTDHHSSFLLADSWSGTVCVLDINGNLTHTIPIPRSRSPQDCTVVEEQLWVGCKTGDVIVMSSNKHIDNLPIQ